MDAWTLIRFLHLVAIAFFVGGQLLLVVAVTPVLRGSGDDVAMRLVAQRFGIGSAVALALIVATGAAMATHYEVWDRPALHAKLGLLVAILALTALHVRTSKTRAISIALVVLSVLIVWFGVKLTYG